MDLLNRQKDNIDNPQVNNITNLINFIIKNTKDLNSLVSDVKQYINERMKEDVEFINFHKQRMKKAYTFPASIEDTSAHEQAHKYGYNPPGKSDIMPEVCSCCNLPTNTEELNLDEQTTPNIPPKKKEENEKVQKFKLSAGISMFFSFIKMAICYLMLRFILTDAFNLISSTSAGTYCTNHECTLFTAKMSSYNKIEEPNLVYTLDILNFITIIISIVFFNYYRKKQYNINSFINDAQHTQDDYTLFVQGIPNILIDEWTTDDQQKFDYAQRLKKFFQNKIQVWLKKLKVQEVQEEQEPLEADFKKLIEQKCKQANSKKFEPKIVTSISLCFDLSEMETLNNIRSNLMKQYVDQAIKMGNITSISDKKFKDIQQKFLQISLLSQQDILQNKKYASNKSMAFYIAHFVGRAFVSFEYQHFRDYILREFQRDKSNFLEIRPNFPMRVQLASTPNDVVWQNMNVGDSTRFKFVLISYFFLMMVLIFAFVGILFMTELKQEVNESTNIGNDYLGLILIVLITVVTLAINYILAIIVKFLTQFERHQTKSNFLLSHIVKTVITQFLNTAIIYYVSSNMTQSPYLSEEGLVVQVSSLFITSAIIQIITNLINPGALIATARIWLKYSKEQKLPVFQRDLNKEIERAEFNVVDRYSYYILQIYACSFYSYLTPIATPCLIATFVVQYWIDKFNLFKRSSCHKEMDFFLSRSILKIFQASLFVFALGNLLFSNILHHEQVNSLNVIALIITGAYTVFIMFAPRELENRFFSGQEKFQKATYSDCIDAGYFNIQRYWSKNPATKFVKEVDLNANNYIMMVMPKIAGEDNQNKKESNIRKSYETKGPERNTKIIPQSQKIRIRSTIMDSDYI